MPNFSHKLSRKPTPEGERQLALIRNAFGRDEFDLEATQAFVESVDKRQKLFIPLTLAVKLGKSLATVVLEWHRLRARLPVISGLFNIDSQIYLEDK